MAILRRYQLRLGASLLGFLVLFFLVTQINKEASNHIIIEAHPGIERKALSAGKAEREAIPEEPPQKMTCPHAQKDENLRMIYMVTPTYKRAEQIPELVRTGQTLLHVKNLKWIVVEDALSPTKEVEEYLSRSGLDFELLTARMPSKYAKDKNKPRGVANRNKGLEWVRNNAKTGVIYFGDDDNAYDIRLFEEIRSTKCVSMFPVGLVAKQGVSSPIVRNGKFVGFFDGWIAKRKFPVDMAGFAVSVELLLEKKDVEMPFVVGYEEDYFLQRLGIKTSDIELKVDGCTQILVWHTQTKKNDPVSESVFAKSLSGTNMDILRKQVWTKK